jgi:squalene-hopene/tetraprenyl-beta-curcumene cyclase
MNVWRRLESESPIRFGRSFLRCCPIVAFTLLAVTWGVIAGQPQAKTKGPKKPPPRSPSEPLASALSLSKAQQFLDGETLAWLGERKCASCHTGYPYLLASTGSGDPDESAARQVRKFFEDRVVAWDHGGKGAGYLKGNGSLKVSEGVTEVVAVAVTLALHDAETTGELHPLTRRALDRMWELQQTDGSWTWNKTGLAPMECDDEFGAIYAALGTGHAPDAYARTDSAKDGLARLQGYLRGIPRPSLHHKAWLLWASIPLDALMTPAERAQTIKDLLDLQRDDGGWSLKSLDDWKLMVAKANDEPAESDGYATGLVLYVRRQAGVPATRAPMRRGVDWLKTHQRVSGCWFTRSVRADGGHHITNAGTAFALMALKACGVIGR